MSAYVVPPEDCLIARAFHRSDSLRQAAKSLGCDPSSLVRKAQRISREHGILRKTNGKWVVTDRGRALLVWLEESSLSQRRALAASAKLRIAAAAWLQEEALIPHVAGLKRGLPSETEIVFSSLSDRSEKDLADGEIDFLVVCEPPQDPAFAHRRLTPEEWAIVVPAGWNRSLRGKTPNEIFRTLAERPFVRHLQVNPNAVLPEDAPFRGEIALSVDHLIGVRAAVANGLGWSFVPRIAAKSFLASDRIARADVPARIEKGLCVWWLRSRQELKPATRVLLDWLAGESVLA